ncbi:hypothetical protein Pelo_13576 [Pelomyxa schiedti]|nr:hypothetical protein Pelo_13576 [Pelomyxa schiedti]
MSECTLLTSDCVTFSELYTAISLVDNNNTTAPPPHSSGPENRPSAVAPSSVGGGKTDNAIDPALDNRAPLEREVAGSNPSASKPTSQARDSVASRVFVIRDFDSTQVQYRLSIGLPPHTLP